MTIAPRRPASSRVPVSAFSSGPGENEPCTMASTRVPLKCLLHLILADLPILAEDRTKTHRMNPNIAGIDKPSIRAAVDFTNPAAAQHVRTWLRVDDQQVGLRLTMHTCIPPCKAATYGGMPTKAKPSVSKSAQKPPQSEVASLIAKQQPPRKASRPRR